MKRVIYLIILVAALVLAGCATHRMAPVVKTNTDTVVSHDYSDTVRVHERLVQVEVPVPVVKIEKVVPQDTTSTLTDGIYTSKAWLKGGLLFHNLYSEPQAKVSGMVQVADTSKVKNNVKTLVITKTITVTKYIEKELSLWDKVRLWAGTGFILCAVCLLVFILLAYIRNR